MGDEIRPFKIHVSEADLEDLRKRIRATRWPDQQTVAEMLWATRHVSEPRPVLQQ